MTLFYSVAIGMCIVFAVIIGMVIYLLGIHNERRENFRTRKSSHGDSGFSAFVNARNERVHGDSKGTDEIEY